MTTNRQGDFHNSHKAMDQSDSDQCSDEFPGHFDGHFDTAFTDDQADPTTMAEDQADPEYLDDDYTDEVGEMCDSEAADYQMLEDTEDLLALDTAPLTTSPITTAARPQRSHRTANSNRDQPSGSIMVLTGGLLMTVGFGLAIAAVTMPGRIQPAIENLTKMGLTPGLMVTLGVVLALLAKLTNRVQRFQRQMSDFAGSTHESHEFANSSLEFLVDAQEQTDARRPASGEELDQVLMTLSRQDEKINNLTRALKMYGKPLVEVSRHVTEVATRTKSVNADLNALKKVVQTGLDTTAQKVIDDLSSIVAEIPTDNGSSAVVQSVHDLDKKLIKELAQLNDATPDSSIFISEARAIGNQLTQEISELMESQGNDRSATELTGLRSDMSALQEAVRSLTNTVASSESPRIEAMATAAAPAPAPAPSVATTAAETTAAPASSKAPGGLAHSISGKTKSEGKNVMSAIAKLKRMRP